MLGLTSPPPPRHSSVPISFPGSVSGCPKMTGTFRVLQVQHLNPESTGELLPLRLTSTKVLLAPGL